MLGCIWYFKKQIEEIVFGDRGCYYAIYQKHCGGEVAFNCVFPPLNVSSV